MICLRINRPRIYPDAVGATGFPPLSVQMARVTKIQGGDLPGQKGGTATE